MTGHVFYPMFCNMNVLFLIENLESITALNLIHAVQDTGHHMEQIKGQNRRIVVLEVNDGPGTKTFDQQGYNTSRTVINHFFNHVASAA